MNLAHFIDFGDNVSSNLHKAMILYAKIIFSRTKNPMEEFSRL